jgi:hypothetical protein
MRLQTVIRDMLILTTREEFTSAPLHKVPPASRGEPRGGSAPPASRGEPRGGSAPPASRGEPSGGAALHASRGEPSGARVRFPLLAGGTCRRGSAIARAFAKFATTVGVSIGVLGLSWGIGTEGRSPNERPDWWKPYENAPAIEVSPEVIAPKGDIPSVAEEAVTRNAPGGVPENLVIGSDGAMQGNTPLAPAIDSQQVLQEAARDPDGKPSVWRGFALFGAFLVLGGGAVFGALRWLSNQLPEPPKPTRRRRL